MWRKLQLGSGLFLSCLEHPTLLDKFLHNRRIIWVSFMSGSIGTLDSLGSTGELEKKWTICKLSESALILRGYRLVAYFGAKE